jgi:8-oxo-dGTP pyrophosphatase MutT (NUDIX family)
MSEPITKYVCGLLFQGNKLLMTEKKYPDWQAGLLNGCGGKVEPGEENYEAMFREAREEMNLRVDDYTRSWSFFATETGPDYVVTFFRAMAHVTYAPPLVNDVGESIVSIFPLHEADRKMVGNLRWLIPLALDWRQVLVTTVTTHDIRRRPSW